MSWALTTFAGVALSVGAWMLANLGGEVHKVSEALGKIDTRLAVVESLRVQERDAEDKRFSALERKVESLERLVEGKR